MSRTLIDLTDLELWNGQHGGTQRVVYGISKNFYLQREQLDDEVVFMAFSARDKTFHTTSFEPIYDRVEAHKAATIPDSEVPAVSLKTRLKYHLRPYVPERVRKSARARSVAGATVHKTVALVKHVQNKQTQYSVRAKVSASSPLQFKPEDTVLILGKPWDNLDIQRQLTREKQLVGFRLVQVVYDMIIPLNPQLHHPSLFTAYTQHMFEAISASDLLLPISQSTAKDVRTFCHRLNLSVPEMKVIRLGDEVVDVSRQGLPKPDPRIAQSFIACVGTIEIRKNHMLLYYAYKLALERGENLPQLVIVGSRGWLSGDFQYLVEHDPAITDKIIILDNVNDASLGWIYQNCQFTVYPSMYEGWGLPVAESLALGKFCLASNSSSIPEIAGDLIEYFSPYSAEQCLNGILKYQNRSVLRQKEQEIAATYKTYSWETIFKQVVHMLKAPGGSKHL